MKRIHEKLFEIILLDVKVRCETGTLDYVDWMFIEELPELAEMFGFEGRMGTFIKVQFHAIIRRPASVRKEEPIPYKYDARVGELFHSGLSIREIVRTLNLRKANVERSIREYRALPVQLVFEFYYEVVAPVATVTVTIPSPVRDAA